MSAHSPGPWHWGEGYDTSDENPRDLFDAGGARILQHDPERMGDDVRDADKRLIAAAPRLLDIVRAVGDTPCPATYGMAPADKRLHEPGCLVCTSRLLAARIDDDAG